MRVKRIVPKTQTIDQAEVDLSLIDPLIEKYKGKEGNTIPLLQGAQNIFGYLPRVVFIKLSEDAGLELSEMYGVATFYTQFRLVPAGKHIIKVCHGTACHVQNAVAITEALQDALGVKDGETTEDDFRQDIEITVASLEVFGKND